MMTSTAHGSRRLRFSLILAACLFASAAHASPQPDRIVLNGRDLTIDQVILVARHHVRVDVDPAAMEFVDQGFRLLLAAANEGIPIYGMNHGVGLMRRGSVDLRSKLPFGVRWSGCCEELTDTDSHGRRTRPRGQGEFPVIGRVSPCPVCVGSAAWAC